MKRFDTSDLAVFTHFIGSNKRSVDEGGYPVSDKVLSDFVRDSGPKLWGRFRAQCEDAELPLTAISLDRLIQVYMDSEATQGEMSKQMQEVYGRLRDELMSQFFFQLSPIEATRFEKWERGWENIMSRFGDITRDVEEMNKCFALARYSASMFHALHVAEHGAIALGDYIGVTDPKKAWGPTERKLRELIRAGRGNLPSSLHGKFDFLEQMNREIDSMVLAWRHKVEHAANHLAILPNTEFTPDIAEHVIGAVRIFMLRLMEGMSEGI